MLFRVLALVSVLLSLAYLHQACNQSDHKIPVSFSLNISSSILLNWVSSEDCCNWEGITCNSKGRVTSLWLPSRGLAGVLPSSIWNLTHLTHLNLSHNRLSGPLLPERFPSLVALQTLDLSYNILRGTFPSFLASKRIRILDLSSNEFDGEIPSTIFGLSDNLSSFNVSNNSFTGSGPSICFNSSLPVKILDFSNNAFSGLIPETIGQCSELEVFRAGFNDLSGPIPQHIYRVVTLREISLHSNNLSGTISPGINNLTRLEILELYENQLTGIISLDIGQLLDLQVLLLHINNLTGPLPLSLSNCTNLVNLNLRVNNFKGDLAAFYFSKLFNLRMLDLGNNNFSGEIPQTLYSCHSLTALRLSANNFEGEILPDIIALKSLSFLSLSNNRLSIDKSAINILMRLQNLHILLLSMNFWNESIPSDDAEILDALPNLQIFAMGACHFSGHMPTWLAKLRKLQVLDFSSNNITGSIPGWLVSLPSLFYLDLSNNSISGEFPGEVNLLPALTSKETNSQVNTIYLEMPIFAMTNNAYRQYLKLSYIPPTIYLSNNNLSGSIPVEISHLKYLHVLNLSNNEFSGEIPSEFSRLENLEILDLSQNHLTGQIPESLKELHFLSLFSVVDDELEGPIPTGGQFDTFLVSSFTGNPKLCGSILMRSCSYQAETPNPVGTEGSSNETLLFGLISGLAFGFIIGTASGVFYPVKKLKFLQKNIGLKHPKARRVSIVPL